MEEESGNGGTNLGRWMRIEISGEQRRTGCLPPAQSSAASTRSRFDDAAQRWPQCRERRASAPRSPPWLAAAPARGEEEEAARGGEEEARFEGEEELGSPTGRLAAAAAPAGLGPTGECVRDPGAGTAAATLDGRRAASAMV